MTLPEQANDILKIARGSNVSKNETIGIRQIYKWIAEYRARLIRQRINRGERNESWYQYLNCLVLEAVDRAECSSALIESGCSVLRTVKEIPKMIETGFVGSIDGKPYQVITPARFYYITCKPFAGTDTFVYFKNKHLYVMNNLPLKYLSMSAIFENPEDLSEVNNGCTNSTCYNINTEEYPMDPDTASVVKELILTKELQIITATSSDKDNDNQNITTPNNAGK